MSIFLCSLVEFMAAVATEKKIMEKDLSYVPGCSSVELVKQLKEFLKAEDVDLLIPFRTLVTKGHQNYDWSNAPFNIGHRNPDDILVELDNFSDFDLYPVAKLQPAVDAQVENDEDDLMAGPTPGPSATIEDASAPPSTVSHQKKRKAQAMMDSAGPTSPCRKQRHTPSAGKPSPPERKGKVQGGKTKFLPYLHN